MLYHTASQPLQFALMLLAGMLISAATLGFAALRRLMCAGVLLSLICDLFLGAVWAGIFCGALVIASRGSLRAFHILAACAGAALFHSALAVPAGQLLAKLHARLRRAGSRAMQLRLFRILLK